MPSRLTRRDFLRSTTAAGSAIVASGVFSELQAAPSTSPNEKLNVACIGVANRASANVGGVAGENVVAICDVDDNYVNGAAGRFPAARKYNDFRRMFDAEKNNIDAVTVSTADHTHAPASMMGIKLGKHVYCEKPLTHSVFEARAVAEAAAKHGVATQMGTQIHATENYRRVVEIIQSGAIGPVTEVQVSCGKDWGGGDRPAGSDPVPANLHWDLWLGPAPERPFKNRAYHPGQWRRYWDFGGGTLGDMACHLMDLPFWALELRHPTSVEAEGPEVHPEGCPHGLTVRYEFPARGDQPAVKFTWSDGGRVPKTFAGLPMPGFGVMFVGAKGQLFADYGRYKLYPEKDFADFKPPQPTIPRSIGHHAEWIKACKEGTPTTCNFDYSGALIEAVQLGNVAFRAGQRLEWDGAKLKATNCPAADNFIQREYRKGWVL